MAKKAAKKEAPAAKAKATAKPAKAAKAPEKESKKATPAPKAEKAAPAPKEAKVEKEKAVKAEKPPKAEKAPKAPKASKVAADGTPVLKKDKKSKAERAALSEEQGKWQEYHDKYKDEKPQTYSISGVFEAKRPLMHKIFGWGFIASNEYDRLEVFFEDGKRMLISNRKL